MEIELILYYCDAIPIVRTRFIASYINGYDLSRPTLMDTMNRVRTCIPKKFPPRFLTPTEIN